MTAFPYGHTKGPIEKSGLGPLARAFARVASRHGYKPDYNWNRATRVYEFVIYFRVSGNWYGEMTHLGSWHDKLSPVELIDARQTLAYLIKRTKLEKQRLERVN